MTSRVFAGLTIAVALLAGSAAAADIAGNDGWLPIAEAVEKYQLSPDIIDTVLDGGGELTCERENAEGDLRAANMNGWFLNGITDGIFGSAHFIYETPPFGEERTKKYASFESCYATLNRETSKPGSRYKKSKLIDDVNSYLVGAPYPMKDFFNDRALYPFDKKYYVKLDAKPIDVDMELARSIREGQEIFLVASGRRASNTPIGRGGYTLVMQRCWISLVFRANDYGSNPGLFVANCDFFQGDSSSLAFVRDPEAPDHLVAVGMLNSGMEIEGPNKRGQNGLPFDSRNNSAFLLAMDENYFHFSIGDSADRQSVLSGFVWQ